MAKEDKYSLLGREIIERVGGKDNITFLTHCVTRLRFNVKDEALIKDEEIKALSGVVGSQTVSGQYQVIIGAAVEKVYDAIVEVYGFKREEAIDVNVDEKLTDKKKKRNPLSGAIETMSKIMAGCVMTLAAGGLIRGLLVVASYFGLLSSDSGTYTVLYAIGDAALRFMPILVGVSSASVFGISQSLGAVIGCIMIYPTLVEAVGVEGFNFLGIPLIMQDYHNTFFQTMIAVYFCSLLYKLIRKHLPSFLGSFFAEAIALVISMPVVLIMIGPVVTVASDWIATALSAVYNFSPVLLGVLLGGPWMILVLFGMHTSFVPILLAEYFATGTSRLGVITSLNMYAFAAAMLGTALKSKDKAFKAQGLSNALSCSLSISEPGIFGTLMPKKWPFVMAVIASSLCTIPAMLSGSTIYFMGGGGPLISILTLFPAIVPPTGIDGSYWGYIASVVLAVVLGFVFTFFYPEKNKEEVQEKAEAR